MSCLKWKVVELKLNFAHKSYSRRRAKKNYDRKCGNISNGSAIDELVLKFDHGRNSRRKPLGIARRAVCHDFCSNIITANSWRRQCRWAREKASEVGFASNESEKVGKVGESLGRHFVLCRMLGFAAGGHVPSKCHSISNLLRLSPKPFLLKKKFGLKIPDGRDCLRIFPKRHGKGKPKPPSQYPIETRTEDKSITKSLVNKTITKGESEERNEKEKNKMDVAIKTFCFCFRFVGALCWVFVVFIWFWTRFGSHFGIKMSIEAKRMWAGKANGSDFHFILFFSCWKLCKSPHSSGSWILSLYELGKVSAFTSKLVAQTKTVGRPWALSHLLTSSPRDFYIFHHFRSLSYVTRREKQVQLWFTLERCQTSPPSSKKVASSYQQSPRKLTFPNALSISIRYCVTHLLCRQKK